MVFCFAMFLKGRVARICGEERGGCGAVYLWNSGRGKGGNRWADGEGLSPSFIEAFWTVQV